MMIVCLDTHVLVWGVRGQATAGQEEMIPRAQALIRDLAERKDKVIIPATVVAEYLVKVDPEHQAEAAEVLGARFAIAPFDPAAATVYSRLRRKAFGGQTTAAALSELGLTRREALADLQVAATAIARQADILYSHDAQIARFLIGENIVVQEIPRAAVQQKLFPAGQHEHGSE